MRAKMAVPRPIGPAPTTSVRAPGSARARRTACAPMARNSTVSGVAPAKGRRPDRDCRPAQAICSHMAPSRCTPSTSIAHAAIRLAVAAGDARAAGDIGVDDHRLADSEVDAVADPDHGARDLMAHDARDRRERGACPRRCGSRCRRCRHGGPRPAPSRQAAAGCGRSSRARSPGERQTTAFMLQSSRFHEIAGPSSLPGRRSILAALLPAATAQTVEVDDDDDQHAGDDALPEGVDVQQVGAVVDGGEDEGADQRAVHRADGAEQRRCRR